MAFRYLIYRTDFGNTIVRENLTDNSTGGTELALFTDFVIPEIQPLYLWRVSGGTDVVPNTDQNINDWLDNITPISPDDPLDIGTFTGYTAQTKTDIDSKVSFTIFNAYTAQTQTDLDGKINIVTGATGNVGEFDASGNLIDSGYAIADLTGGTTGSTTDIYVSGGTLNGTVLELQRSEGQANVNIDLSGLSTGGGGGIFSSEYQLNNVIVDTKPGAGIINLNNATPSGVTEIYIDNINKNANDVGDIYSTLTKGDDFSLQLTTDSSNTYIFELVDDAVQIGGTGNSGYVRLPVSVIDINGTIPIASLMFAIMSYNVDISNLVTKTEFNSYTGITDTRISNIETDVVTLSGSIDQNTTDIQLVSGITTQNTTDIAIVSGATVQNASDIANITGETSQLRTDIDIVSGKTDQNTSDIAFISGVTDTKQDILSAGAGINSTKLTNNDLIELDLNAYTVEGNMTISVTGATNAVFTDLRTIAKGLEYGGDYNANFTVRSLVDKGYVDAVAAGLDLKESVRLATTTNIDLTLGSFGGTIDGVTVLDGWRVLVKDQTDKTENGIYVYSSGGNTFARAIDFVDPNVTAGAFTFVETGSTLAASGWVLVTQDPITIGTTELTFTQFSEAGQLTAGVGIDITAGVISFDGAAVAGDSITWSGTQLNIDISTGNTLGDALANKLETSVFASYTAVTDTRITNIETDIANISGDTTQLRTDIDIVSGKTDQNIIDIQVVSGATDQNASDIAFISGVTDTKLDTAIFTGYTASTQSNELFLVHTGGTELNTIAVTAIAWDSSVIVDSAYTWTGGSVITINDTGNYEINYNIPFNQNGLATDKSIGTNIILNNLTTIDNATSAGWTSKDNSAGSINVPTVLISLTAGDTINLVTFRAGSSGSALSSPNGSILIKKKDKLQ